MVKKSQKIKLKDVAEQAGLSISTVTKVLSGQAKKMRIRDDTVQRVQKIADKLCYVPNQMAQKLRTQKSGLIGIYLAYATDAICAGILSGILQELPRKGFFPLLTVEETGFERCYEVWMQNDIEGLIFCGPSNKMSPDVFENLKKNGIAHVIAGNPYKDPKNPEYLSKVTTVQIDNRIGIRLIIDHLIKQGRNRITFIAGPIWHTDADERRLAYENFIKNYHQPMIADIGGNTLYWQRGYLSTELLIKKYKADFDAIIAYDDMVALGTIKCLTDNGIKIPSNIAVTGFDNQPLAHYAIPSLTSVNQPADRIGRESVQLLKNILEGKKISKHMYIIPKLVARTSTVGYKNI
ncbi:MAG: LacI family DNA-binding transcriptional regulator [Planctomycetota bacterium]|jgi:LacI family transcriptional regulator